MGTVLAHKRHSKSTVKKPVFLRVYKTFQKAKRHSFIAMYKTAPPRQTPKRGFADKIA